MSVSAAPPETLAGVRSYRGPIVTLLSVAGFLKQLTHQRATREATVSQAGPTVVVSDAEGLVGHRDSAQIRLDAIASRPH